MTWPEKIRSREGFTALYRSHQPAAFRFVLSMTGDPMAAAEVTQDVFVWLIHHPESFDRSAARAERSAPGSARRTNPIYCRAAWVTGDDGRGSGCGGVRAAIAALPPRYREVVVLCDLEGLSYEEAAAAAACATGTVRSRLHRARQFLARKLASNKRTVGCTA